MQQTTSGFVNDTDILQTCGDVGNVSLTRLEFDPGGRDRFSRQQGWQRKFQWEAFAQKSENVMRAQQALKENRACGQQQCQKGATRTGPGCYF